MPAGTFTLYTRNFSLLNIADLLVADVRFALVSSAYVPDTDETTGHNAWANVSANEIAAGFGYTAGGKALVNDAAVAIANGFKYSSDNVSWTAAGGTIPAWRYGVMYANGALWGLTSPLVGYFLGDTAPADVPATTVGNTLQLTTPANGWFTVS